MPAPVQHWEVNSNDYKKAQEFYRTVFDWEINEHEGMNYALVSPGGDKSIGGGIGAVQEGQSPSVTFYVTVDNIQAYLDKVEKAGGRTVLPVTPVGDFGECGMFADLDGNVIGLWRSLKS